MSDPATVDYRALLVRYLDHLVVTEGSVFLMHSSEFLSEQDRELLDELSRENVLVKL